MSNKEIIGILTRPYDESAMFSESLEEYGIWSFIEPMLEIRPLKDAPRKVRSLKPDDFDGILITSRHALYSVSEALENLKHLPIFVVGDETAKIIESEGFTVSLTGQTAAELTAGLRNFQHGKRLLYLSGVNISHDFSDIAGSLTRVEVYQAEATPYLSPELVKGLKSKMFSFVVFFSARTAEIFESLIAESGLEEWLTSLDCFAFSPKIAKTVSGGRYKSVQTTEISHRHEMLKEILKLYSPSIN